VPPSATCVPDLDSASWDRLEPVLRRFEEVWRRGQRPAIGDYLPRDPRELPSLLAELVHLDLEYRLKAGDNARIEDYLQRYPELVHDQRQLLGLIETEYRLRNRCERDLTPAVYIQRFPQFQAALSDLLNRDTPVLGEAHATVPTELAADLAAGGPSLPNYEILSELGRGGMGVVYKARHLPLNRLVAVKVLLAGPHAGSEALARFRGEAAAIARLHHPNLVQVYEVGEYAGRPYAALEFVDGPSLAQHLNGTPLPARQAAEILQVLAQAIHYAHEHGIVHRDLKPANILLAVASGQWSVVGKETSSRNTDHCPPTTVPKITDFGLAKQLDTPSGHTRTGAVLGTPSYMAPEQAHGKAAQVTPRSDIYGLGAILYEMLTGRPPFRGESAMDTVLQVLSEEPVPPSRLCPRVPRDLELICLKCLEKDPQRRYASAAQLAEELRCFLNGEPLRVTRPVGTMERFGRWCRRNPKVAALAAAVLVSLVAGTAVSSCLGLQAWHDADEARRQQRRADREAEQARLAEGQAEEQAKKAARDRDKARAEETKARRLAAVLALDRGLNLCEQQHIDQGLLWQARSLELSPGEDADLRQVIRANWGAWRSQLNRLHMTYLHRGAVTAVAFSSDGQKILTASADGTARLWDTAGNPIGPVLQHEGPVKVACFGPNGKTILTAGDDRTARLWDVATGKPIGAPMSNGFEIRVARFSPDGAQVLTACDVPTNELVGTVNGIPTYKRRGSVHLWDAATAKPTGVAITLEVTLNDTPGSDVLFSPDGKTVVTASFLDVRLWDAATGKQTLTIHPRRPNKMGLAGPSAVAFSPEGKRIAIACKEGFVQLFDAATGQPVGEALLHKSRVEVVRFDPRGELLLTGTQDGMAVLWHAATGQVDKSPFHHQGKVATVAFSPNGRLALTGSVDKSARLWDTVAGRPVGQPLLHTGEVQAVAFSPDSRFVLTGGADGSARLWEVAPAFQSPLAVLRHLDGRFLLSAVAASADGKTVAAAYGIDALCWKVGQEKPIGLARYRHDGVIRSIALSPDGTRLLTAGEHTAVFLWDVTAMFPKPVRIKTGAEVCAVAFSPDGDTFVTGGADGHVQRWQTATGEPVGSAIANKDTIRALALSPDGKRIATASGSTVRLWETDSGKQLVPVLLHPAEVAAVAFSPNGELLGTGCLDGAARLWQSATGKMVGRPLEHGLAIRGIAFSPDGRLLLTGSSDKTARLWDTTTGKLVGPPMRHAGAVVAVAYGADGRWVLTGGDYDCVARFWEVPRPAVGEAPVLTLTTRALTGIELDADEVVKSLTADEWRRARRLAQETPSPTPP
jgi:WD40 repeat protein/serine/threonine protein kinase